MYLDSQLYYQRYYSQFEDKPNPTETFYRNLDILFSLFQLKLTVRCDFTLD